MVRLLNALIGAGYHEGGPPYMPLWPAGAAGFSLYGQPKCALPQSSYQPGTPSVQVRSQFLADRNPVIYTPQCSADRCKCECPSLFWVVLRRSRM